MEIFQLFGSIFVDNSEANNSISKTGAEAEKSGGLLEKMGGVAKTAALAVGAAAIGIATAITGIAVSSANAGDRVDKMSQKLGVSREGFQEWDYILSQNGASIDSLGVGMKTLQNAMDDISEGGSKASDAFKKIGLNIDEVKNMSPEEAFAATVKALQEMPPGAEKTARALELFGKQGMELMPLLNQTADATDELRQQAHDLGIVLGDEAIDAGVRFGDALDAAKKAVGGFANAFGAEILPALTEGIEAFIGLMTGAEDADQKMAVAFDNIIQAIGDKIPEFVEKGAQIIVSLAKGVVKALPDLVKKVLEVVPTIIKTIGEGISDIFPILTPLTSALSFLADHLNIIIPVAAAFLALWKATDVITFVGKAGDLGKVIGEVTTKLIASTVAKTKDIAETLALNALYVKDAAVKIASTAATAAHTVATTAQGVATGILNGQITLVTVAQWLWNAAMAANPIGLVIAGVVALAAAITGLCFWLNRESDEQKALKKSTDELKDANKQLIDSLNGSTSSYEANIRAVEESVSASKRLTDEVYALMAVENKTAEQKERLAALVQVLNQSMDGLNLQYDAEKDSLSRTQDEIYNYIDAKKEQMEIAGATEQEAIELTKKQIEVEKQLNAIIEERAGWDKAYLDGTVSAKAYNNACKDLNVQEAELSEQNKKLSETFDNVTSALAKSTSGQSKTLGEYKANLADVEKSLDSLTKSTTEMFKKISDKSETSVHDMIANLRHNQVVVRDWADNLALLAERGIDEGLLQTLRDAGPESAGIVAELTTATKGELKKLSDTYAKGGEEAANALKKSLGLSTVKNSGADLVKDIADSVQNDKSLDRATEQLISNAKKAADGQIERTDFSAAGKQIVNGLIKGLESMRTSLEEAVKKLTDGILDTVNVTLDIHSPSRKSEKAARFFGEGFIKGILDIAGSVNDTVGKVFGGLDVTPDIGVNFNAVGSVLNTASGFVQEAQSSSGSVNIEQVTIQVKADEIEELPGILRRLKDVFGDYSHNQVVFTD